MNVLLTFDIEVWCHNWITLDESFPSCFERYIFGRSPTGDHALPQILETLNRYGLKGVFFVEPLFSTRFGIEHLTKIVEMIREADQEVQLHLHPEWTDVAREALIPNFSHKRQFLTQYDTEEQCKLINHGIRLLEEAGASRPIAFRSGNFSCNAGTFIAAETCGLRFDSSINPEVAASHHHAVLPKDGSAYEAFQHGSLTCIPMSSFRDGFGRPRHAQLTACSIDELTQALIGAEESQWKTFVLLSHGDELMVRGRSSIDPVAVRRFEGLCEFLALHRSMLPTVGFNDLPPQSPPRNRPLPQVDKLATMKRFIEQAYRRLYR